MMNKSLMRKLFDSKVLWGIVSVLVSLSIWVYVTSVETEETKQTFRGVKVELVGEESLRETKNLVITDMDTSTVTLEIVGPRRIVGALSAADLVAQIDVSKLSQSAYTSQQYSVIFPDGIDSSGLQVSSKTPETVNFMTSKLTKKVIQVKGSFDGSVADGYTAELPVFEPSTITVYGPENYLTDISYAWVEFGADNVESTYVAESGFILMSNNGKECSTTGLTFSDDTVISTLTILEVKEIPLYVDLVEGAGAYTGNTKVTIEPDTITLAGDSAILSDINKITLATIDLSDFASSFSEVYSIKYDNSLKNLTGITEAKVTVEVVGLETKSFVVKDFTCKNVTDGFAANIISESITVTLRGTAEELEKVKSENIRAVADLTDYNISTGQYMPIVKIYVDGFTNVGAIGENTISIEIRKE